ncbi:MAG TPA: hypothetical protein VGH89_24640 [Pseudonocardia sp.]|jgi:hypothetical protein
MAELVALLALAGFVTYGATISPRRRFSWAMYSGSTKALLWVTGADGPRPARLDELGLAPDNHFLTVPDLARVLAKTKFPLPLEGVIIGYTGDHAVRYDPTLRRLFVTPTTGNSLENLSEVLRRLSCP